MQMYQNFIAATNPDMPINNVRRESSNKNQVKKITKITRINSIIAK